MGNINSHDRYILEKEKSLLDIKIQNLENKYNTIFELYKNHILNTNTNINNLKNNIDKVLEFKEILNISGEIDNTSNSNYQNTDEEFKSIINTSINNEIELINKKIKELEEIKSFHQNLITDLNDKQNLNDIIIQDLLNSFNKMKTNK